MCKWGDEVAMTIAGKPAGIDRCIVPLVAALNKAGIATVASCCGHGRHPGNIMLADGRELIICPDYDTARALEATPVFDTEAERAWKAMTRGIRPEHAYAKVTVDGTKLVRGLRRARARMRNFGSRKRASARLNR